MAEPQIVNTLARKRDQIERAIARYQDAITRAELDLAHVNATLRMFEAGDAPDHVGAAYGLHRIYKRGEMTRTAKAALAAEGPLDTRELAVRVIRAKRLDDTDKPLRKAVAYRLVNALAKQVKRGTLGDAGKRAGVRVWDQIKPKNPQ